MFYHHNQPNQQQISVLKKSSSECALFLAEMLVDINQAYQSTI